MERKRLVAKKVRICDIVGGKYFYGSKEEMKPSYVITALGQKISRVNIVATVTDKFISEDGSYASITLDDGTEAIRAKAFHENVRVIDEIEKGDLVMVIGRLREYGGEVYISCEIVKKVESFDYESFHKLRILRELLRQKKILEELRALSEKVSLDELKRIAREKFEIEEEVLRDVLKERFEEEYKQKILKLIKRLDTGEGVGVEKIFELSTLPAELIERTINELLKEGALYESFPGKFRVVK